MDNIIRIYGEDYKKDKEQIESHINGGAVFLLDNLQTELYQYIDYLHDTLGMKTKILNKLKICREISFAGNVTLLSGKGAVLNRPHSMGELLKKLQKGTRFRLVIENDDHTLMANIVQQLIYIDYPITEVDMKLRSEYKDAAKTALFMKHIQTLHATANSAVDKLLELSIDPEADEETREKLQRELDQALAAYEKICEQIDKAMDVEMKVAVAASKKTGKSVLVNCMLGVELAPTSLELATPNTCIYKRSSDDQFHLQMVEEDGILSQPEDFDTEKQLYERLLQEFKTAQDNAEGKFAAPNMQVSYVSNGNNFESYTVYDTPGPDLAGADHKRIAKEAVNACDVAIFAIDYTKYLTDAEESFLKDIKSIFQEKHKFHTLIFVINKMDQALNDKGTKSRVKSIDFIRSRLRKIGAQYSDCIVFATSAQDYFYTVELEKAAEKIEELSCLRDPKVDLYQNVRPIKDAMEAEDGDENLINLLSNLDSEVGRIKTHLGYPTVNVGDLRHYSGIPQLMDYVSYIAKSKARDEIVNSITYTIAAQCGILQTLTSKIANMENLMNKTQQEISQISDILDSYVSEVKEILSEDLTEEDLRYLDPNSLLASEVHKKQLGGAKFPISLPDVLDGMCEYIGQQLSESQMQEEVWNELCPAYLDRIGGLWGKVVRVEKLNITAEELQKAIGDYQKQMTNGTIERETNRIKNLATVMNNIVSKRLEHVAKCSENCQRQLQKNDCQLHLPELPAFEVSIPEPKLSSTIGKNQSISVQFNDVYGKGVFKKVKRLRTLVENIWLFHDFSFDEEVKVKKVPSNEQILSLYKPFCDILRDAKVYDGIRQILKDMAQSVKQTQDEVAQCFKNTNNSCAENADIFKKGIDDRDYYKDKLADYARLKNLIASIEEASKDFLDTWALVLAE